MLGSLAALQTILQIAGAVGLLLWATRQARRGFEKALGPRLDDMLTASSKSIPRAGFVGCFGAVLLQSSTAMILLVAEFLATNKIALTVSLAIVLGADLGTAIVVQLLSSRPEFLIPLLLVAGAGLALRGAGPKPRALGRIFMGLALVLVSLGLIAQAIQPVAESPTMIVVFTYVNTDPLAAFLAAAGFAWLAHSSVATVLLIAGIATQGVLSGPAIVAMVLGANVGASLIPLVLLSSAIRNVRLLVWGNIVLRGGGAVLGFLAVLILGTQLTNILPQSPLNTVMVSHLVFNASVLGVGLLVLGPFARLIDRIVPKMGPPDEQSQRHRRLDPAMLSVPGLALLQANNEVLNLSGSVNQGFQDAMNLFRSFDEAKARRVSQDAKETLDRVTDLKHYIANIGTSDLSDREREKCAWIFNIASRLAASGDLVDQGLVKSARRMHRENLVWPDKWYGEVAAFKQSVEGGVQLGIAVAMSDDNQAARRLIEQKETIRLQERELSGRHIWELNGESTNSIRASEVFLNVIQTLKQLNANYSAFAQPMLERSGELLKSRLVN